MNRRDFLQAAAVLAAGASVLPNGWSMNQQQRAFLAARPDYIDRRQPALFTPGQRATVTAVAEHIIPRTETPGARDAGVPRFIELMVADWFNTAERERFMAGLDDLDTRAQGGFTALAPAAQLQVLEQLEDLAGDAAWFDMGNTMRIWDELAPFICQFKELTVLGFFLSEVGATQVLRENPMGSFEGEIPLGKNDPAYAVALPMRLMSGSQDL